MPPLPLSASGRTAEEVIRHCARTAASIIMNRFPGRAGSQREEMIPERIMKGRGNFATETDLACERAVLELLAAEYPDHPVVSEEMAAGQTQDWNGGWLWVVDPLDGTHNFSQGVPIFAFNIALCYDGEPVLGLTYAPATGDEYFAQAGGGMTVNGGPASASLTPSLAESVWGMDLGYDDARAAKLIGLLAEVWPGVQSVRIIGSAALGLAFAACGRYDLFVHHYLFPWDIAPGILMVREAGGLILDRDGAAINLYSEGVVAGSPGPVQDFLRLSRGRAWR